MSRAVLVVTLLVSASGASVGQALDRDRYHERQDACRELDVAHRVCATGGLTVCDQALLDRLQRQRSGPWGSARADERVSALKW